MKKTHVTKSEVSPPEQTGRIELNDDGIGFVESWDFSKANMSEASRKFAVTTIASVCYGNPKSVGSISLYDRLACESVGLPSSSFEFVPVLIRTPHFKDIQDLVDHMYNFRISIKYGEYLHRGEYLLTNLRALMADVGKDADKFFNTEEECAIIAKYHKVFKAKMDIATSKQFNRHRVSLQELSRRYVSGKKSELEFYISPKMRNLESHTGCSTSDCPGDNINTIEIIELCVEHYNQAISNGIKPEEARRILPMSLYTTTWSAWQPSQLKSYMELRTDSHTQIEHRNLATAMEELTK